MKIFLINILLILSLTLSAQSLELVNTKDLVQISERFGLDSALVLTKGYPLYHLDKEVAVELMLHIKENQPSERIERFLTKYALNMRDAKFSAPILQDFFERKQLKIKDYDPKAFDVQQADYFDNMKELINKNPKLNIDSLMRTHLKNRKRDTEKYIEDVSDEFLFSLIENSTDSTESLLIKYYESWKNKAIEFEEDYILSLNEKDSRQKEILKEPFEKYNKHCYTILRILKKIESGYYDDTKLLYHQRKMASYLQQGFGIGRPREGHNYTSTKSKEVIDLEKVYTSFQEVDFENEPELIKLIHLYADPNNCWKYLLFNDKVGYLDVGCQSAPLAGSGVFYRIELDNNKLNLYKIYFWIS